MQRSPWAGGADQQGRPQGCSWLPLLVPTPCTIPKVGRVGLEQSAMDTLQMVVWTATGAMGTARLIRACLALLWFSCWDSREPALHPFHWPTYSAPFWFLNISWFAERSNDFTSVVVISWSLSSVLRHNFISRSKMVMTACFYLQKFSCQNWVDCSSGLWRRGGISHAMWWNSLSLSNIVGFSYDSIWKDRFLKKVSTF